MTRIDSVRAASGSAKESVRHAAEVVAPYAETARDTATHYAQEAGARLGPKVSQARSSAREGYDQHVVPRIAQARKQVPPEWDRRAKKAAKRARKAAERGREAAERGRDYAAPRIEHAVADARAAAGPAKEEATQRGTAALAALRGQVSPQEIEKLSKRRARRARTGRVAKRLGLLGLLAGGAYAAWRWWDKQANPDWLVEPPAATEVDRAPLTSVDGSAQEGAGERSVLDPEVEAKQAEADQRKER
ncbi:DUF5324 family protein [Streptomyces sp. ODS28]|uniref:DUF5324 family protein n=1 Tax=Streptomyces sp. ODS28 TaxID=3136688 RepID=UPI0031E6C19C